MAILQISQIQVRRGLQQDLPQLASGELGWSLDQRRLFIGNGTLTEGAPAEGTTEILTQYSDLLNISDAYTFKGSQSGYTSRTGPTTDQPITRTLQRKLDDYVNVRDFGATGDGNTNDTLALQRAIDEVLFGNFALTTPRLRRVIHLPAGIYLINASLKLPSYVYLQGEGKGRTVIRQSSNLYPIFQLKDSENKIDSLYATGSATPAKDITVSELTLEHLQNEDIVRLDTTERVEFVRVVFKGSQSLPNSSSESLQNAVYARPLDSGGYLRNVTFIECDFYNCTQGILLNGENVRAIGCNFSELSQALVIDTTLPDAVTTKNIRVVHCNFDGIARSAIKVSTGGNDVITSVLSSLNYYGDVGTGYAGPGSASQPVIYFEGSDNYSTGDSFERPDSDHYQSPRVYYDTGTVNFGFTANSGITLGMQTQTPGRVITIAASQTNANTGILFSGTTSMATMTYYLSRPTPNAYRQGKIDVIKNGTNVQYMDEYIEYPDATNFIYPGPTGVTFTVQSINSSLARLVYTSDASGSGSLTYSITSLR